MLSELFFFTHKVFTCSILCMYMDQHLWLDCTPLIWDIPTTPHHQIVWFCSVHNAWCVLSQIFSALSRFVVFSPHSNDWWPEPFRKTPTPLPFDLIINMNTFIHSQGLHMSLEWAICFAHHPFCVTEIFLITCEHKFSLVHLFISN